MKRHRYFHNLEEFIEPLTRWANEHNFIFGYDEERNVMFLIEQLDETKDCAKRKSIYFRANSECLLVFDGENKRRKQGGDVLLMVYSNRWDSLNDWLTKRFLQSK